MKTLADLQKLELFKQEIIDVLVDFRYKGDISDIGNEIGIVIGKYTEDDVKDFKFGLEHGISLSNGTH